MSKKNIEGNERRFGFADHSQPTLLELMEALEDEDYILIVPIGRGETEDGEN